MNYSNIEKVDMIHVVDPNYMGIDIETNSGIINRFPNPNYLSDEIL